MVNETNDNGIRAWLRSPEIRLHFQSGPGQTFTQCYSCDERKGRGGEKRTRKMGVTVTFMQTTDGGHWFREDVLVFLRGNKKYKWKPHTQDIVAGCTMSWATRFDHQPSKYTLEEHKYIFVSSVKAEKVSVLRALLRRYIRLGRNFPEPRRLHPSGLYHIWRGGSNVLVKLSRILLTIPICLSLISTTVCSYSQAPSGNVFLFM